MLEPRYDHKSVEEKVYKLWEKLGCFDPDNLPAKKLQTNKLKPFSIIMPPPNANGSLHIGHAFEVAIQDLIIRFERMRGRKTLWLPGADHAGFETQVVFDKKLEKEGRNRFAIDRQTLWKEMWDFTQTNKKIVENQLRKLGASCDWSREKFTLDPDIVKIVYETFEKLFRDGLIYRGLRVVNWCPKHKTALSDLEVKYVERQDPLYYIKYGPLTLATVRPETKFGDTALAVNPKDKRYKEYIGKEIEAEGVLGPLKFKVISDEAVDPKFGTGVIKVTPAHDMTDFEIWQRHKDEIPDPFDPAQGKPKIIIDENGRLTGETGEFKGLKVAEAREKVAAVMEKIGILEKVDSSYTHQVAVCYKCGNVLEPIPKLQWWMKMTTPLPKSKKSLRDLAVEAVKQKKIKLIPKRTEKIFFNWMKNLRDWNISRQIVWGIRIPAWYCININQKSDQRQKSCDIKLNSKMKGRWFLVRHGESKWNKEQRSQGWADQENPLTEEGIKQAEKAGAILKEKNIDLIISSDLSRCKMTAEIIAKAAGAEVIFDPELRERHMGIAQGMLAKDRQEMFGNSLYQYDEKVPGGETWRELEKRIWSAFLKHKRNHKHKNIVIVTHGGPLRLISKNLKNLSFEETLFTKTPTNAEIIELGISDPCKNCGSDIYEQDPDVFDTWFSSGQWPFATLMTTRPRQKDLQTFYPTNVMAPGYDILFLWVARMIMLGIYRTGKIPFKNVYLHGLVRDKDRQKMSKSKGNVIDPLGAAESYGTDAIRMALLAGTAAGNDPIISEDKIRGYRNFATKIWNISRFVLMNRPTEKKPTKPSPEDKKNLKELEKIKKKVAVHIEKFEFHLAAETVYHYIWHTLADKIVEAAKPRLNSTDEHDREAVYQTLETLLLESLKMLHPFMPFITEEIFQKFKPSELLMTEKW